MISVLAECDKADLNASPIRILLNHSLDREFAGLLRRVSLSHELYDQESTDRPNYCFAPAGCRSSADFIVYVEPGSDDW